MKKDFQTKKELFRYLKEKCGDVLDKVFVISVRANVLRQIYDEVQKTDKFWGKHMKKRIAWLVIGVYRG